MMASTTGSYQGLIRDFGHFRQVYDQYLKIHNRPRGDCSDFPPNPQEQQQLVRLLFEAAQDCSQTYEPEGSQSVRRIQSQSYSDIEFELVLWPVLQKATNRKLNGERDVQNAIGIRVAQENGIKTNQSGELVDRNGQSYGTVKKRSVAFQDKITRTRSRGRQTKGNKSSTKPGTQSVETNPEDNAHGAELNNGEPEDNTLQSTYSCIGYTEDLTNGGQRVSSGYALNSMNEHAALPSFQPMTNLSNRSTNQFIMPEDLYTLPQNNGGAMPAFASGGGAPGPAQTATYMDFNLDLSSIQAEGTHNGQFNQGQDFTDMYNYNPTVPAAFDGQLNSTTAQGQTVDGQYYFQGPSNYHMQS
ncbi:hypothetical protein Daesc_005450 [Daldinia eschscholtzii]|uniref:Uncharacterized protein n=1 Tax=Daldinia eschscholtzii TaxID=292717 RepID=A0AAX6MKG3_9PEZI